MTNTLEIRLTNGEIYYFNTDNVSLIRHRLSIDNKNLIVDIILVNGLKYSFSSDKLNENYLVRSELEKIKLEK